MQGENKDSRYNNNLAGHQPIWTISASISIIPTIFTPDVHPAATLPIYPRLGQAPSMLDCISSGLIAYLVATVTYLTK